MPRPPPKKKARHTVDDHMFGDFYPHDHDGDADHDHDNVDPGPLEDNPIWQRDNVALSTVGIDIGSAGTQIIFSNIHLQRVSSSLASRYVIVDRKTTYESPVSFTPYLDQTTIDGHALGGIIDRAYGDAGVNPKDIDTGVVILTGEALRRENAESIAGIVAEQGGDFVTATAGNHMEAMLAAYGSGAARASHEKNQRILNVDIGGGTTKLTLVENGVVQWTAALSIGGRLIVAEDGLLIRIDPAGAYHAQLIGLTLRVGDRISAENMHRIALSMADLLTGALTEQPLPKEVRALFLTDIPTDFANLGGIMFSGGVAEYIYNREQRDFGDLGIHLGRIMRTRVEDGTFGVPILNSSAGIRATALGASQYSVQLSGQTSTITAPGKILPRRNMQVLKPDIDLLLSPSSKEISARISRHYTAFDLSPTDPNAVLAFEFSGPPEYRQIRTLADGIVAALSAHISAGGALYILIDGDIAQTLGGILRDEIGLENELLILDGISLRDFDYIDLGKIRLPSFTVPVTIKSLLFRDDHHGPGRRR